MIDQALQVFPSEKKIVLLCDSWYPKGAVLKAVAENPQLELISNVRVDMKLYDLPPKPTGKCGRTTKKGHVLTMQTDFELNNHTGDYAVGTRKELTNLFPEPVYSMVTACNPENPSSYRFFISTIIPVDILMDEDELEKDFPEKNKIIETFCLITYMVFAGLLKSFFMHRKLSGLLTIIWS